MQIRYKQRRDSAIHLISGLIFLFSLQADLQAYPGCCRLFKVYEKEWDKIGKKMYNHYEDAQQKTVAANDALTDTVPYFIYRANSFYMSMLYIKSFGSGKGSEQEAEDNIMNQYLALYATISAPSLWRNLQTGGLSQSSILGAMNQHPPKLDKSLMDFVVRTYTGDKASDSELSYGNFQLTKQEIEYSIKEQQQECSNQDLQLKLLEGEIFMLEMALSKLATLSNGAIEKEKN